ncbi:protein FAM114A2 [Cylas formicarius]|uniref:protein FAM114A2 n=1 Tax=Cylas formicarius TaxID=197179 RepID=UPI002958BFEF|nr:protein FAM114A2 [Cylas formicarius]XP_060530258.1 protein FAM114A2 [Cylas formicarius]
METSDSDYFESADEDVYSDEESVASVNRSSSKLKKENLERSINEMNLMDSPQYFNKNIGHVSDISSLVNSEKKGELLKPKLEENKEENLWDVDEINWETEGKLEESDNKNDLKCKGQKNETSKNVQDLSNVGKHENLTSETDLWDENEIDWEVEGHKEDSQKSDFVEKIDPKIILKSEQNKPNSVSGWGNWGNWDVSSILNTATNSVSSLTAHVSHGISTVLEANLGVPDPEEMAKLNKDRDVLEDPNNGQNHSPSTPPILGFGNIVGSVSHITKFVESTGTRVISGGLDTLESIGKKTMEVLQEGDPGLKKKRAFLKFDSGKPVLSQVLREAKEKAEQHIHSVEKMQTVKFKNYETLFDDHQGLVHLEALEMLSKLCNMKLENLNDSLHGNALKEMQETMEQVKELCELPEDEEEEIALEEVKGKIQSAVKDLNVAVSYDKLVSTCEEIVIWLANLNLTFVNEVELHQQAIESLAQITALAVEQFHKIGELLLVKEHRSTADEADSLVQLTLVMKSVITKQAGLFCDKLNCLQIADKEKVNELITNIFYEASNSCSYLHDAFQLLIPVLQVGAT